MDLFPKVCCKIMKNYAIRGEMALQAMYTDVTYFSYTATACSRRGP